jgi:hypothetical protein
VAFAGCEHRRHDHRAGVHRAAFKRVVEILAVDCGAVDHRRTRGCQCARMPDRRARSVVVAGGKCGLNVILITRRDGETDHVDKQIRAFAPHRLRQLRRVERGDFFRQMLGNCDLGKVRRRHEIDVLGIAGPVKQALTEEIRHRACRPFGSELFAL